MVAIRITGVKAGAAKLRKFTDFSKARRVTYDSWRAAWAQAARAFVTVAVRNALIQTGMTAASFFPLARAVGRIESVVLTKVAKRGRLRRGVPELPAGRRSPGIQGPRAGRIRGKNGFTYTFGKFNRFNFQFGFQTTVFQHAFHEATGKSTTIKPGMEAFVASVTQSFPDIARSILEDFFRGRNVTIRRTPRPYYGAIQQLNIGGL